MTRARRRALGLALLWLAACAGARAQAPADDWSFDGGMDGAAGHGQVSIGFQVAHTRGLVSNTGLEFSPDLATDVRNLAFGIDYWLSGRWSLHASIPFVRKRAVNDLGLHDQRRLDVPHPESPFIDEGRYHGAWQDWSLGVAYHAWLGPFEVTPHAYLTIPSHDYVFFASAPVGQGLRKLRLGADAAQRLGRSNFHYSVGYSYEFVERIRSGPVHGVNTDNQYLRLAAWYDASPQLSLRVFGNRRVGKGLTNEDMNRLDPDKRTEWWYQHDRLLQFNYAIAGAGATWRFDDRWAVSVSGATMVWVRVNHKLRYAYEVQLVRSF